MTNIPLYPGFQSEPEMMRALEQVMDVFCHVLDATPEKYVRLLSLVNLNVLGHLDWIDADQRTMAVLELFAKLLKDLGQLDRPDIGIAGNA